MKKLAAIFIFSVYLFGATDAYQMLKLPLLIQHYIQHKKENSQMSLEAFLQMHYSEKMVIDNDFQQDMQLPFKTHDEDYCLSVAIIIPEPIGLEIKTPEEQVTKYTIQNITSLPFTDLSSIFQPPKV